MHQVIWKNDFWRKMATRRRFWRQIQIQRQILISWSMHRDHAPMHAKCDFCKNLTNFRFSYLNLYQNLTLNLNLTSKSPSGSHFAPKIVFPDHPVHGPGNAKISSCLFVTAHWAIEISFRGNFPWFFVSKLAQQTTEMSWEIFAKNRFFRFSRPCRAQLPSFPLRFLGSRERFWAENKTL